MIFFWQVYTHLGSTPTPPSNLLYVVLRPSKWAYNAFKHSPNAIAEKSLYMSVLTRVFSYFRMQAHHNRCILNALGWNGSNQSAE